VIVRLAALAAAAFAVAAAMTKSWSLAALAALFALIAALTVRRPREVAPVVPVVEPAPAPEPVLHVRTPYSADAAVVLDSLLDATSRSYDVLGVHLWLRDEGTHTVRLIRAAGSRRPPATPVSCVDPVLGVAAEEGSALFRAIERLGEGGQQGAVWRYALPVGTGDTRGVAGIDVKAGEEAPSADALNSITSSLRGPLTAAVALHVAQSEMETAAVLLAAVGELSAGEDPAEVMRMALARAMQVSHASTGSVMLPDEESGMLRIVAADGLPRDVVETAGMREGEGIAGWVYASGTPLLVEDLPGQPSGRRHGVLSSVTVPIGEGDDRLGVLNVGSRVFPARFTDGYIRALGILGAQTAVALRAARERRRTADLYLANLRALAAALEAATACQPGASSRSADLAVAIGRSLELPEEELRSLEIAAVLHDLGMWLSAGGVGASERPLSTVDRGLVRAHPGVGADVLEQVPSLRDVAPIVYHHHEHFDGKGYDVGLSGEDIPLGSRIIAVADAFLAMTADRPYRDRRSVQAALDELSATSGSQFDPAVVEAFVRLIRENPDLALADK
jgi:HD-GYP domain-containing protein (c-di-GMP phosphodiesterase class II)